MVDLYKNKNLFEIIDIIKNPLNDGILAGDHLIAIHKRLLEITYEDHNVSYQDRKSAEALAESVYDALSKNLSYEAMTVTNEAIAELKKYFHRFGKGSVLWQEEEEKIAAQNKLNYESEIKTHLDQTADTISANAFVMDFFISEILKLLIQKNIATPNEVKIIFENLNMIISDDSNEYFKEKIDFSSKMIKSHVFN
jgi:hypothetical protein